jgi:hypothetical protein
MESPKFNCEMQQVNQGEVRVHVQQSSRKYSIGRARQAFQGDEGWSKASGENLKT